MWRVEPRLFSAPPPRYSISWNPNPHGEADHPGTPQTSSPPAPGRRTARIRPRRRGLSVSRRRRGAPFRRYSGGRPFSEEGPGPRSASRPRPGTAVRDAADRFLKKALVLDPHHARALGLLFEIHRAAGHYAEALGYLQRRRKVDSDPKVLYNIAGLYQELGQGEKALETVREFLSETKGRQDAESRRLRVTAESFLQFARLKPAPEKPAPPPAKSAVPDRKSTRLNSSH